MANETAGSTTAIPSKLKLFFALSRTPHGLIDMTTPAFAALLYYGGVPPFTTVVLGLVTVFAGYTSVYAINDLIDQRVDREKLSYAPESAAVSGDLDALMVRHPLAQGLLGFREALIWAAGWGLVALAGASLLNPACVVIFGGGCLLEALYCKLLKITHFRTVINGIVKTLGAVAAVYAVDPQPRTSFLAVLFLTLFFWEIGGQNIPNDWADIEEDRRIRAKTVPVHLGPAEALTAILGCLTVAVVASLILFQLAGRPFPLPFTWAVLATAVVLLVLPAVRLYSAPSRHNALVLFNRASYYPLALLVIVLIRMAF